VVEAAARSGSLITARDALDQGRDVMAVPGHPFDARASGCNMLIRDGATLVRGADDVLAALGPATDIALSDSASTPRDAVAQPNTPRLVAQVAAPRAAAPVQSAPKAARSLRDTNALHQKILDRLGPSPLAEDQLIRDLSLTAGEVAPQLVSLELDGRIVRQPGGLIALL